MSSNSLSRREALLSAGAVTALSASNLVTAAAPAPAGGAEIAKRFPLCFNPSTIRGQNPTMEQEVDIAGKAGYTAIEPWLRNLQKFTESGGKLKDLRKRIADHGLAVVSAIGFAAWLANDDAQRAKGLEEMKRDMDVVAQIGGVRIAAPPAGIGRGEKIELMAGAERYRKILELGDELGVAPEVEMWGGNPHIGRISQAIFIALEAAHPKACFLGDVFHMYRAGCDIESLRLLGPQALPVLHFNDYPAQPPRELIRDEHRIYPGDGIAPISKLLQIFHSIGAYPALSLELFNRFYWQKSATETAEVGIRKMRAAVAKAFA